MSDEQTITAEEFEGWIRCPDAIKNSKAEYRNDAAQDLWLRMKTGLVRSAARAVSIDQHPAIVEYFIILKGHWSSYKGDIYKSSFWRTGNIDIDLFYPELAAKFTNHFIDVRFHPADIAKIPGASRSAQPSQIRADKDISSTVADSKPLSDSLLRAWCDLYEQAYPANERSEPLAAKSVAGMFPGKSVTRIRLRAVLDRMGATGKKGRPRKGTAD
jgi:hypothetical protein